MKMFSALGMMYVDKDISEVESMLERNSEFNDCILNIEENQEVKLNDPIT